jgi:hypothetical protein
MRELLRRAGECQFVQGERLALEKYLEFWLSVVETTVRPSASGTASTSWFTPRRSLPVTASGSCRRCHLQQLYAARHKAGTSPEIVVHLHAALASRAGDGGPLGVRHLQCRSAGQVAVVSRFQLKPLTPVETQRLFAAAAGSRYRAAGARITADSLEDRPNTDHAVAPCVWPPRSSPYPAGRTSSWRTPLT